MTGPRDSSCVRERSALSRRRFLKLGLGTALAVAAGPLAGRDAVAGLLGPAEAARAWPAMGTLFEVRVPDLPRADALQAMRRVKERVESLEAAMTLYRPESPLVALNRSAPGAWRQAPMDLCRALELARSAAARFPARYDPGVAPALRALGLHDLRGGPIDEIALEAWRHRPGLDALELDPARTRVRRLDPALEIDLGGIGKGIAVDAALRLLAEAGSRSALVNFGGQVGTLGAPPDRPAGWRVGLTHPRDPGVLWTEVDLPRGHLATSGDYERRVDGASGTRHHILDPARGASVQRTVSMTVWAATGTEADVLSTAMFVDSVRGADGAPLTDNLLLIRENRGKLHETRSPGFPAAGS